VIAGASLGEIGFTAVLMGLVLFAPWAPRLGALIGGLFDKQR
jgi:hypothetical protein